MPEGDTVATYARHLRPWLVGAVVDAAECRWPRVVHGLAGCAIHRVHTLGKHLLVGFSDGTHLRVHLRMKGTWHRYDPGENWWKDRGELALALHVPGHQVVCFGAPEVERIDDRALGFHPVLSALGPDLLQSAVDLQVVVQRAAERPHSRVRDLLLDQRVACGLGNVYASELPFLAGIHPYVAPSELGASALSRLYGLGSRHLQENVGRERNTTGRSRPGLWVYGRAGRRCLRCGAGVESGRQDAADRVAYWCPGCQPPPKRDRSGEGR